MFEALNEDTRANSVIYDEQFEDEYKVLWYPIKVSEINRCPLPRGAAPRPDGILVECWGKVPAIVRAVIFNVVLLSGECPDVVLNSRTVLIPKVNSSMEPGDYRPLSIASVVIRQLHKILAARVLNLNLLDSRQRGFIRADGVVENTSLLSGILRDARTRRRELYLSVLDVRKAFDTVLHSAILKAMRAKGIPVEMRRYMMNCYIRTATTINVDGVRSSWIHPTQGVRQGDPHSPLLFDMVLDQ